MKVRTISGLLVLCLVTTLISVNSLRAESNVKKAREELDEIREQKKEIKGDMKDVVKEMEEKQKKMDKIAQKIDQTNDKIYQVNKKLKTIQKRLEKKEERYKKRLRIMYQNGEMGHMSSLLAASSFSEFLSRFEMLRLIVKQDRHLVNEIVREKKVELKEKKKLDDLTKDWEKQAKEAEQAYEELQEVKQKNKVKLAEIQEEERIQEKEVRKMNLLALRNGTFEYPGGPFHWPGDSHRVTSSYGYRKHPVTGVYKMHTGIDTAGKAGAPIYAAADGVVIASRPSSGYGWIIMIDHGSKLTTLYAHMYPHTVRVRRGDYVERGQRIASIGSNGYSTGPHNHFEVRKNGKLQNPMNYLE